MVDLRGFPVRRMPLFDVDALANRARSKRAEAV